MKRLLVLLLCPVSAYATSYNWPDVAPPCNTVKLQDCINAVAANDIVNVTSSGTLSEGSQLQVNKPMTLRAGPGYRPVLAAGTSIAVSYSPAAGTNWNLTLEGFTLLDGAISVQVGNGNPTLSVRRMDITNVTQASTGPGGGVNSGIGIRNNGAGSVVYDIAENRVRLAITTFSQPTAVYMDSSGGGSFSGNIHDNRFSSGTVQAMRAVLVYPQGASTTRLWANQISGGIVYGISVFPGNASLAHSLIAVDNAITCTGTGYGIIPVASPGTLDVQIFNNTMAGCQTGFGMSNSGTVTGRVANNVFAYNGTGLNLAGFAGVSNDHNLLFANGNNFYTPGAGTVTSDPLLRRGAADARLTSGSPAIDAADSAALRALLTTIGSGEIDADGLRRFKGAGNSADIGAFEYGDISFGQRASNSSSFVLLDNAALSGNANARPQVTTSREVESYQTSGSLYYVRFDYAAPNYFLATEGGVLHYVNSGFNVFAPGAGDGVLLHTTTVASVSGGSTVIDDAYLNGHPERIVLAHHRGNGAVTSINDAISAGYLISKWILQRNTGSSMPFGADFHVYAQDPSLNAFSWATPEVGDTSYTVLNQPIINGEPCAQIYAQQSGTANPHPTQLRYVSALKRWRIENADGTLLPNNTSFMLVVDEAATVACRYDHIFHDGVEVLD